MHHILQVVYGASLPQPNCAHSLHKYKLYFFHNNKKPYCHITKLFKYVSDNRIFVARICRQLFPHIFKLIKLRKRLLFSRLKCNIGLCATKPHLIYADALCKIPFFKFILQNPHIFFTLSVSTDELGNKLLKLWENIKNIAIQSRKIQTQYFLKDCFP